MTLHVDSNNRRNTFPRITWCEVKPGSLRYITTVDAPVDDKYITTQSDGVYVHDDKRYPIHVVALSTTDKITLEDY
jgi:hypothetical protein